MNNLVLKDENTILNSIRTYKKALMDDINLSIRLSYNQQTYLTRPVEWNESIIIFEAPMSGTDDIILPKSINLDVILVSKISLFYTTFRIQKNYRQENKLFYVAEISSPIIKKQQREAFRLDVLLDVQYEMLSKHSDGEPHLTSSGICVNISLGGMCLVCEHQFHTKDQLSLSFSLMDVPLTFKGEVLALGEATEQGNFTHRIQFLDLKKADMNQLNRLIFEKQRLQLKHT